MIPCNGQHGAREGTHGPVDATGCNIRPFPHPRPTLASDARYVRQLEQRIAELEAAYDRQSNVVSALADRAYAAVPEDVVRLYATRCQGCRGTGSVDTEDWFYTCRQCRGKGYVGVRRNVDG